MISINATLNSSYIVHNSDNVSSYSVVLFIEVSRSILYTREFNLDCIHAKHKFITLVRVSEMPSYSVLCCTKEL